MRRTNDEAVGEVCVPEPLDGLLVVLGDEALAGGVHAREVGLRDGEALADHAGGHLGGLAVVLERLLETRGLVLVVDAALVLVHPAERVLRRRERLLGGLAVPAHGLALVLVDAGARGVEAAEAELSRHVALGAGGAQQLGGLGGVGLDSVAVEILQRQRVARLGHALVGERLKQRRGGGPVLRHTAALSEHGSEVHLRLGVVLVGSEAELLDGLGVVAILLGLLAALELLAHRNQKDRRRRKKREGTRRYAEDVGRAGRAGRRMRRDRESDRGGMCLCIRYLRRRGARCLREIARDLHDAGRQQPQPLE